MDQFYNCSGIQYRVSLVVPLNQTGRSTAPSFSFECTEESLAFTIVFWVFMAIVVSPWLFFPIRWVISLLAELLPAIWSLIKRNYTSLKNEIAARYDHMRMAAAAKKVMIRTTPEPSTYISLPLSSSTSTYKYDSDPSACLTSLSLSSSASTCNDVSNIIV